MAEAPAIKQREGLSLTTLVIAAVASGIAAVVVSHVWKGGTVLAAAMTPVIVSIVKEALRRPIESDIVRRSASKVTDVATIRKASGSGYSREETGVQTAERPSHPAYTAPPREGTARSGEVVVAGPRRTYGGASNGNGRLSGGGAGDWRERLRGRPLKIAIVTGLLAFVVAAVVITVPELVFGGAVSSGHSTTLFGGKSSSSSSDSNSKDKSNSDSNGDSQSNDNSSTSTQQSTTPSATPTQTEPAPTQTQTQPPATQTPAPSGGSGSGGATPSAPSTPAPSVP
jgi:uncharacterized membrane protein YvlD (DUF360 family)